MQLTSGQIEMPIVLQIEILHQLEQIQYIDQDNQSIDVCVDQ
jgi:hypothetical protein